MSELEALAPLLTLMRSQKREESKRQRLKLIRLKVIIKVVGIVRFPIFYSSAIALAIVLRGRINTKRFNLSDL